MLVFLNTNKKTDVYGVSAIISWWDIDFIKPCVGYCADISQVPSQEAENMLEIPWMSGFSKKFLSSAT